MAITLSAEVAQAKCNAGVDLCDDIAGPGTLEILDAADVLLVTLTLGATAFGGASLAVPSVATAMAVTPGAATTAGIAAKYQVKNHDGDVLWSGTAGLAGTDMILSDVNIALGQIVSVTSWDHSQP